MKLPRQGGRIAAQLEYFMTENVKKVISDYYDEMHKAFKTGTLDCSKLHLADEVAIIEQHTKVEGRKGVEEMLKGFAKIVDHFDIKRQFFDHDSCCTFLYCITKSPRLSVVTVEWIIVKNGKIVELHPVFDTRVWEKLAPQ